MANSNTRALFGKGARAFWLPVFALSGCLLVSPLGEFHESDPETSTGGASGAGGTDQQGGGPPQGGSVSTGGSSMEGGAGSGGVPDGEGGAGHCTTSEDCARILGITNPAREPARCRPDNTCVLLNQGPCFTTYGDHTDPDAVFMGALIELDPLEPERGSSGWYPLALAIDEFNIPRSTDDRPPGLGDRQLVVTMCDNTSPGSVDAAMDHLVGEIQVPAVLAYLKPADLMRAFENHDDIFFLSPIGRTNAVTELDLAHDPETTSIWNLLGQPSDYTDPYASLMRLVEPYVFNYQGRATGAQLKLALVIDETNDSTAELGRMLEETLFFNGIPAVDNGENYFRVFSMDSTTEEIVASTAQQIIGFIPDIVVSAAGTAFTMPDGILIQVERNLGGLARKPFYVISPYESGNIDAVVVHATDFGGPTGVNSRVVALSIAPPINPDIQTRYERALGEKFSGDDDRPVFDTGNYYDAIYYLADAAYGAGLDEPLTSARLATGLQRLLVGDHYEVGPAHTNPIFELLDLRDDTTLTLEGTLGPPDFTGGYRRINASVTCIFYDSTQRRGLVRSHVLIYDRENLVFQQPPEWTPYPCYAGFYQ
jgi:hypothetical protein